MGCFVTLWSPAGERFQDERVNADAARLFPTKTDEWVSATRVTGWLQDPAFDPREAILASCEWRLLPPSEGGCEPFLGC